MNGSSETIRTVITYGTFDLFHYGHLRFLEKASQLGDRLIVAVSTDEFNFEKYKKAVIPFAQRKRIVGAIDVVDSVISEIDWDQKLNDIVRYDVDVLVMGDDWVGEFNDLPCVTTYLNRTANISSTAIRKDLYHE